MSEYGPSKYIQDLESRFGPDEWPSYRGIGVLFNADEFAKSHTDDPEWVPRHHWEVVSAEELREYPEFTEERRRLLESEGIKVE